jgi:hypothetical protein
VCILCRFLLTEYFFLFYVEVSFISRVCYNIYADNAYGDKSFEWCIETIKALLSMWDKLFTFLNTNTEPFYKEYPWLGMLIMSYIGCLPSFWKNCTMLQTRTLFKLRFLHILKKFWSMEQNVAHVAEEDEACSFTLLVASWVKRRQQRWIGWSSVYPKCMGNFSRHVP